MITAEVEAATKIISIEPKDLYMVNEIPNLIASQNSASTKTVNNKQIGTEDLGKLNEAVNAPDEKIKIEVVVNRYRGTVTDTTVTWDNNSVVSEPIFTDEFDAKFDGYYPRISLTGKLTFSDTPENNG